MLRGIFRCIVGQIEIDLGCGIVGLGAHEGNLAIITLTEGRAHAVAFENSFHYPGGVGDPYAIHLHTGLLEVRHRNHSRAIVRGHEPYAIISRLIAATHAVEHLVGYSIATGKDIPRLVGISEESPRIPVSHIIVAEFETAACEAAEIVVFIFSVADPPALGRQFEVFECGRLKLGAIGGGDGSAGCDEKRCK